MSQGVLPTVVWPSDVEAKKAEIDPDMRRLALTLETCKTLSAEEAIAVDDFLTSWRTFFNEKVGVFGSSNKWDEALRFQDNLRGWQDHLSDKCTLVGPKTNPTEQTKTEDLLGTLKLVAVVGAVIAGVVLLAPIVYEVVAERRLARATR